MFGSLPMFLTFYLESIAQATYDISVGINGLFLFNVMTIHKCRQKKTTLTEFPGMMKIQYVLWQIN